jgi:hypothetical protein
MGCARLFTEVSFSLRVAKLRVCDLSLYKAQIPAVRWSQSQWGCKAKGMMQLALSMRCLKKPNRADYNHLLLFLPLSHFPRASSLTKLFDLCLRSCFVNSCLIAVKTKHNKQNLRSDTCWQQQSCFEFNCFAVSLTPSSLKHFRLLDNAIIHFILIGFT